MLEKAVSREFPDATIKGNYSGQSRIKRLILQSKNWDEDKITLVCLLV